MSYSSIINEPMAHRDKITYTRAQARTHTLFSICDKYKLLVNRPLSCLRFRENLEDISQSQIFKNASIKTQ